MLLCTPQFIIPVGSEDDFPGVSQRPLGHYGHAALSSGEKTLISPEKPSKMALIGRQTMV